MSDRSGTEGGARLLFGTAGLVIIVLLVRDLTVLPQTAGSLTYLGALFIVLLAPLFTGLWGFLDRFGLDPSQPVKCALGLILAGLAFLPLMAATAQVAETGVMASVWFLVAAYLILEMGEMCLSPVGLSAVTQLSVPRVVSLMMGTWFLATAFSQLLASQFGKLAAIEIPEGETLDLVGAANLYGGLFQSMFFIGASAGLLALVAAPLIKRGMHGAK